MDAGGMMITLATRTKVTVIKGDGGTHVYMWDGRRVHHMQGAEREFVLFGSSRYNIRRQHHEAHEQDSTDSKRG